MSDTISKGRGFTTKICLNVVQNKKENQCLLL